MMNEMNEEKPSPSTSDFLHEYLQKTNLSTKASLNQFAKDHQILRDENETEEAFTKRVKKMNYLNLAQQLIRNSNHSRPTIKSPTHVKIISFSNEVKKINSNLYLGYIIIKTTCATQTYETCFFTS